jgi:AraC family transcriptional regulator
MRRRWRCSPGLWRVRRPPEGPTVELLPTRLSWRSDVASRRARRDRRPGALTAAQVAQVSESIDAHLHEDLSLDRLAAQIGYSTAHFARAFRAATGQPPARYAMIRRVERARALLLTGDLPVSAIAAELGFADHSHLTRAMRRQLGVTPSQLRSVARH